VQFYYSDSETNCDMVGFAVFFFYHSVVFLTNKHVHMCRTLPTAQLNFIRFRLTSTYVVSLVTTDATIS